MGFVGATDRTRKIDLLAPGWFALKSGEHDAASELFQRLKEWFSRSWEGFSSTHGVLGCIKSAVDEFKKHSPLYGKNCCDLLIAGFVNDVPMIAIAGADAKGHLSARLAGDFYAVGSGATIAMVILGCRDYHGGLRLNDALYYVYEAKRFSEKADGVGPLTHLLWFASGLEYRECVQFVSASGIALLEKIFRVTGLNSEVHLSLFPSDFTATQPDPQSTTDETLLQPPSPESSEVSGES
jgi:hypothetical protein